MQEYAYSQAQVAAHASIAVFGALVHALDAQRRGDSKSTTDFIALTIMSSFSGAMFALVGLHFFPDQLYLTTAMAGAGGYLGIEGMALLINVVRKRLDK